jgi:cation:H+ antiporter
MTALFFVAGAVLLIGGAELLVRGSSRLAVNAGISPLVVGLTVVAFGTGAPELAVTVGSTWSGQSAVALGNVIGSNIANILLILGVSALVAPLVVAHQLVRLDVPLLVGASVLTLLLSLDGSIGRWDGLLLFTLIVVYTVYLVRRSRREERSVTQEYEEEYEKGYSGGEPARRGGWLRNVGLAVFGLLLLVVGAQWLVSAAVDTAEALGVSQLVIGLTIVAAGTSLPEVATSVLATLRGNRDIAVGNVVGSSIFNLLAVLGLGGLLAPAGIAVPPGALTFDLPVMIATAVAALPIFFTGYCIQRWEGAVFLGYYVAFTGYLVLDAVDHGAVDEFGTAMVWFVLPLTFLTLGVVTVRAVRRRRSRGDSRAGGEQG